MRSIRICGEPELVRAFLELPRRLYTQRTITQSLEDERSLLAGTHYLNRYVTLTPFVVMEGRRCLARCVVTQYPEDEPCYFGFFECEKDPEAFRCLMDAVEGFAREQGHPAIEGPLDASLWLGYRFKANRFDQPPYVGEPYNKEYYLPLFEGRGYLVKERYASNQYATLPQEGYAVPKFQKRWNTFAERGYTIRSPRPDEWDRCIVEVYQMIRALYRGFLTYHPITQKEFVASFDAYRDIVDLDLVKMAYRGSEPVGFLMGVPDYGNLAARRKTPATILRFLSVRRRPRRYVLLYMGVMPRHLGIGGALVHAVMGELARRGTPSIGALIRDGNINYDYAKEYLEGRYEYVYLRRSLAGEESA